MRFATWRRAVALSCLLLSLPAAAENPVAATGPDAKAASAKSAPAKPAAPTPSDTAIRQRFAKKIAELDAQEAKEVDAIRAEMAKCPKGRPGNDCKQKAGKAHAKPINEIRKQRVAARQEQEIGLANFKLEENLRRLDQSDSPDAYKVAERKRLEASAKLRRDLAVIQGEGEIAKLNCGNNDCRKAAGEATRKREAEARQSSQVNELQKEVRELSRTRPRLPSVTVGEKKPAP